MASRRIGFQRPARPYARTVREGAEARAGERTEAQRQRPLSHMHAHLTAHSFSRFPHHTQLVLQLLRQPTQPPTNQERGSCYRNKEWNRVTQEHEKVSEIFIVVSREGWSIGCKCCHSCLATASQDRSLLQLHAKVRGQQLAQLRCSVREQKGKEVEVLVLLDRTGSWLLN